MRNFKWPPTLIRQTSVVTNQLIEVFKTSGKIKDHLARIHEIKLQYRHMFPDQDPIGNLHGTEISITPCDTS